MQITKGSVDIRDISPSEIERMLELTLESYIEYSKGSPDGFWERYSTNIAHAVREGEATERIAAFLDGEMAGSVLLCEKSMTGDQPEIRLLAVSPKHRQHGIARKLMDECETRLRKRGVTKVILHTTYLMQTARAWYERSGYKRCEELDFEPVPGFIVWGYEKRL